MYVTLTVLGLLFFFVFGTLIACNSEFSGYKIVSDVLTALMVMSIASSIVGFIGLVFQTYN